MEMRAHCLRLLSSRCEMRCLLRRWSVGCEVNAVWSRGREQAILVLCLQ